MLSLSPSTKAIKMGYKSVDTLCFYEFVNMYSWRKASSFAELMRLRPKDAEAPGFCKEELERTESGRF